MHARFVPGNVIERMTALVHTIDRSTDDDEALTHLEVALADSGATSRRLPGEGLVLDLPGRALGRTVLLRARLERPRGTARQDETPRGADAAMLVGAAMLLARDPPPKPVRLLLQTEGEHDDGARRLIAAGVADGVLAAFGAHLDRLHPVGLVAIGEGIVNGSTDVFRIAVRGRSAHGARPHESVDTVVVGSLLVMALQTIVSREVDPAHPSVVSIGRFVAEGSPHGIAGHAVLEGTIRAFDPEVRAHLLRSVQRIASAIGVVHDAAVDVEVAEATPPLVHAPQVVELARDAAREAAGASGVATPRSFPMNGDDFALYVRDVPGALVRIGAHPVARPHDTPHARSEADERAFAIGAAWLDRVARLAAEREGELTGPSGDEAA